MKNLIACFVIALALVGCKKSEVEVAPIKELTNEDKVEIVRKIVQSKNPYIDFSANNTQFFYEGVLDPLYWNEEHLKEIKQIVPSQWLFDPFETSSPKQLRGTGSWTVQIPSTNSKFIIFYSVFYQGGQWGEFAEATEIKSGPSNQSVAWRVQFNTFPKR